MPDESGVRRWVHGEGGPVPADARRMVEPAGPGVFRWSSLGRRAGRGYDQVDAERLLRDLVAAGLAAIHERRNRRGDWEPYEWRLTKMGLAFAESFRETVEPVDPGPWLATTRLDSHPVVRSIADWLTSAGPQPPVLVRLVMAVGDELRQGRIPHARTLSLAVGGHTKALRLRDWASQLEEAFGLPLEDVVQLHGQAALVHGPFDFAVDGRRIDGLWSRPWLALTADTLAALTDLRTSARRLLTIENLMPFEEEVRRGLPADTVALFTGGFPRRLELALVERLCGAGITCVDHWSDLDLGGLRILHHLQRSAPVPVRPYRMEPELLDRLPTQPLTDRDRRGLEAWVTDPTLPCIDLARAILERNAKAEQEGWYARQGAVTTPNLTVQ